MCTPAFKGAKYVNMFIIIKLLNSNNSFLKALVFRFRVILRTLAVFKQFEGAREAGKPR